MYNTTQKAAAAKVTLHALFQQPAFKYCSPIFFLDGESRLRELVLDLLSRLCVFTLQATPPICLPVMLLQEFVHHFIHLPDFPAPSPFPAESALPVFNLERLS